MRLNVECYQCILAEKGFSDGDVIKSTGLSERTYKWILENGSIECDTLERIADAVGCKVRDILKPDYEGYAENVIEWVRDGEQATLSLSQRRTISRVKQLAESHPEECQILAENKDGSLYAHIPVSWIKISPPAARTEKQIEHARSLYAKSHSTGNNSSQIPTKIVQRQNYRLMVFRAVFPARKEQGMTNKEVCRYLELVNRKGFILVHSGIGWKPGYAAELEAIDKEIVELRKLVDQEHERRRAVSGMC